MKIGDVVRWDERDIGLVTYVFFNGDLEVLFYDGLFQLDPIDCEVICEGG